MLSVSFSSRILQQNLMEGNCLIFLQVLWAKRMKCFHTMIINDHLQNSNMEDNFQMEIEGTAGGLFSNDSN
jgi:hypothetical protein